MNVEKKGDSLVITLKLRSEPKLSSTGGKNLVVVSSGGFASTPVEINGQQLRVNVCGIIPA